MSKSVTIRIGQTNLSHLRMTTTYAIDRQPIATRERTLRMIDGRELDFELAVDLNEMVRRSLRNWGSQIVLPLMYDR